MNEDGTQPFTIENCPRCGGEHGEVLFVLLSNPVPAVGLPLTHWAVCPGTGAPVLARFAYRRDDYTVEGLLQ